MHKIVPAKKEKHVERKTAILYFYSIGKKIIGERKHNSCSA
jgi:hypothetical protein